MKKGRRPLAGLRIAVTRARGRTENLSRRLRASGARVLEASAIRTMPNPKPRGLKRAMQGLGDYAWIVFTSAAGVDAFFSLLRRRGMGSRAFSRARLAAIGPGTGKELLRRGVRPDLIPPAYVAESLSRALRRVKGMRVLIPRAEEAREMLPKSLAARGAKVTILPVYRTLPDRAGLAKLKHAIRGKSIDAVLFTSPSTVRCAFRVLDGKGRKILRKAMRVFSIGPVTGAALARLRVPVAATAKVHTSEGLVKAIVRYYMKTPSVRRLRDGRRQKT